jgi:hypothetical protein
MKIARIRAMLPMRGFEGFLGLVDGVWEGVVMAQLYALCINSGNPTRAVEALFILF